MFMIYTNLTFSEMETSWCLLKTQNRLQRCCLFFWENILTNRTYCLLLCLRALWISVNIICATLNCFILEYIVYLMNTQLYICGFRLQFTTPGTRSFSRPRRVGSFRKMAVCVLVRMTSFSPIILLRTNVLQ